jgi:triosephosphate isomerase
MKQIIAGNWKMNNCAEGIEAHAKALRHAPTLAEMIICPPFPLLAPLHAALAGSLIKLGAQDCHSQISGAHTGDVAATMLSAAGASHVIVGHSERRTDHHETNALVRAKAEAAQQAGLIPIICVGETEAQRDAGHAAATILAQLAGSLPATLPYIIAYEPIWAIGTGKTPTLDDIAAIHATIRNATSPATHILYGGSVKPANAAAILALSHVNGALVGGASLTAADLLAIAIHAT